MSVKAQLNEHDITIAVALGKARGFYAGFQGHNSMGEGALRGVDAAIHEVVKARGSDPEFSSRLFYKITGLDE